MAIAIDDSWSVGETNYKHMQEFVGNLVSDMIIGLNGTHVSVITYTDTAIVRFFLNKYTDTESLQAAIDFYYNKGKVVMLLQRSSKSKSKDILEHRMR